MKTKRISRKLDTLVALKFEQKSKKKQLKALDKIIVILEQKESKFRGKLDATQSQTDHSKYERKLEVTKLHISKARAYRLELLAP